jgi:hypothetical protein
MRQVRGGLLLWSAALSAIAAGAQDHWPGGLHEHPAIQYAVGPTTDRVAKLSEALARGARTLERDARTGYLLAVLNALGLSVDSQLLVFSKTGVQRALIDPRNPRALFFDDSVVVGYVPGAPLLELAAHDPRQGVIFYTLDQAAASPSLTRRTSCLTCHVSASTLDVPGMLARNNAVDENGNVMPQLGSNDVTHLTPHPDRWGGYFVTTETTALGYNQRAHAGNITFSGHGNTSNQVFIDWINSAPETRGYLSGSSDIVALQAFDHQMHAINLITRLNWETRAGAADATMRRLEAELADYLLFVGEVPPSAALTPPSGFVKSLEARTPKDRLGRSFGQIDAANRLLRYPCSYMVYSQAFDGLPEGVRQAVYQRMVDVLSSDAPRAPGTARVTAEDRRAVLEILRDTKPDFPH